MSPRAQLVIIVNELLFFPSQFTVFVFAVLLLLLLDVTPLR